jgi:hypothetical protein
MSANVHDYADQLRQYATHFAMRDWRYTRDTGDLVAIRYDGRNDSLKFRLRMALRSLYKKRAEWEKPFGVSRWRMFKAHLRRDDHMPDGVLDNGGVIVHWEETGEYLQYVQPSVGALFADLMDAHPDLPEVQAIADEMKRINDDYAARVADEEADS